MRKFTDTRQQSYASSKKRSPRVSRQAVAKMKIKKGDTVMVVSGKDKGKTGEVVRVMPSVGRVVVEGVALMKRHLRKTAQGQSGRIVERPAAISASNVMVLDPDTKKPTRIGREKQEGKNVRITKKSKTVLK
jgi:large subunit ribosomal protein L24